MQPKKAHSRQGPCAFAILAPLLSLQFRTRSCPRRTLVSAPTSSASSNTFGATVAWLAVKTKGGQTSMLDSTCCDRNVCLFACSRTNLVRRPAPFFFPKKNILFDEQNDIFGSWRVSPSRGSNIGKPRFPPSPLPHPNTRVVCTAAGGAFFGATIEVPTAGRRIENCTHLRHRGVKLRCCVQISFRTRETRSKQNAQRKHSCIHARTQQTDELLNTTPCALPSGSARRNPRSGPASCRPRVQLPAPALTRAEVRKMPMDPHEQREHMERDITC